MARRPCLRTRPLPRARRGANTPGIIKYPFWRRVAQNPQAVYAVVNKGEAYVLPELRERSISVDGDIAEALVSVEKELA